MIDILPMCDECHLEYEVKAAKFKKEKFAFFFDIQKRFNKYVAYVKGPWKLAETVMKHGDKMPHERKMQIFDELSCMGDDVGEMNEEHLQKLCDKFKEAHDVRYRRANAWREGVLERFFASKTEEEIIDFVSTWRQHFIDNTKPEFLPEGWGVRVIFDD